MISKLLRLLLLTLLLTTAAKGTAAIPPAESVLPSDTFVFFTIPDFDALRAASKVSPQLRFWNDPAMKPFRDKFRLLVHGSIPGAARKKSGCARC